MTDSEGRAYFSKISSELQYVQHFANVLSGELCQWHKAASEGTTMGCMMRTQLRGNWLYAYGFVWVIRPRQMFEGTAFIWFVQIFFVFLSEIPNFCVFHDIKSSVDQATTVAHLWDIYGLSVAFYKRVSIIMLQKSSAQNGCRAEDWRNWREKCHIKHAEVAVL